MIITGRVIDQATGAGIPFATVELTDKAGNYLGYGVNTNNSGSFSMDSGMIQPGTYLRMSSVNYLQRSFSYQEYIGTNTFALQPANVTLDEIVITAKKTETNKNTALWVVGGLALAWYLFKKR